MWGIPKMCDIMMTSHRFPEGVYTLVIMEHRLYTDNRAVQIIERLAPSYNKRFSLFRDRRGS